MFVYQANMDAIAIEQDHDWATGWATSNLDPRPETVTVTLTQGSEAGRRVIIASHAISEERLKDKQLCAIAIVPLLMIQSCPVSLEPPYASYWLVKRQSALAALF